MTQTKATVLELSQRVSIWCKLIQGRCLSTFRVSKEICRFVPFILRLRGQLLAGNIGGNAEQDILSSYSLVKLGMEGFLYY